MFRRSDFIDARYAFSFVFANFGIAIAARMPMITTTIRSSIRVKPLRVVAHGVAILGQEVVLAASWRRGEAGGAVRHPPLVQPC